MQKWKYYYLLVKNNDIFNQFPLLWEKSCNTCLYDGKYQVFIFHHLIPLLFPKHQENMFFYSNYILSIFLSYPPSLPHPKKQLKKKRRQVEITLTIFLLPDDHFHFPIPLFPTPDSTIPSIETSNFWNENYRYRKLIQHNFLEAYVHRN